MTEREYNQKIADCQAKSELRLTWTQWIIDNFAVSDFSTWFGTLTFHDFKSTYSGKRYFYKWLRWVNQKRFGRQAKHKDISVSWALGEEYQSRGSLHYHLLMKNTDALMRNEAGKVWWTITGGYGKILPSMGVSAAEYITKYILKDGQLDIDLRDDNTGQRVDLTTRDSTEAERGRAERLKGFSLPLDAN